MLNESNIGRCNETIVKMKPVKYINKQIITIYVLKNRSLI